MILMEDTTKVQKKVDELNSKEKPGNQGWTALNGYNALTRFEFGDSTKGATFYPSSGIPVKVFINAADGEIRVFPATFFEVNYG